MEQSEDPLHRLNFFYAEHFLYGKYQVPDEVQEELEGCILFSSDEGPVGLRAPKAGVRGMGRAIKLIGKTMPVHYGEPAGATTSCDARKLKKACRKPDVAGEKPTGKPALNGGSWGDKLRWRRGRPQDLVMMGMWDKQKVNQLRWLEDNASRYFGTRRCFGFAGSTRLRSMPIAGSLLWSSLLRGERLVIIWGPDGRYARALVFVQRAGTLLIIPPGHEYAFYNIRSCVSDEGNFYMISFLRSYEKESRLHVPGTMEILLARPGGRFEANIIEEVIAYFVLVCMMTVRCIGASGTDWTDDASDFVSLLTLPVFAYLPRIPQEELSKEQIDFCTKVLAWTAPFAALVLHRSLRHCRGRALDINKDSVDCAIADKNIPVDRDLRLFDDSDDDDTDFFDSDGEDLKDDENLVPTDCEESNSEDEEDGCASGDEEDECASEGEEGPPVTSAKSIQEAEVDKAMQGRQSVTPEVEESALEATAVSNPVLSDAMAVDEPSLLERSDASVSAAAEGKAPLSAGEVEGIGMNSSDGWKEFAEFAMGDIDENDLSG
ncbi:hypothetical protein NCC49_000575, partial [Naganishia albida]